MAEKVTTKTYKISNLVKTAKSSQIGPDLFCNHVVATIGKSELVLDFYQLAPKREDTRVPFAEHRQRIVLPQEIIPGMLDMFKRLIDLSKESENLSVVTNEDDQLDMSEAEE